MAKPNWKNRTMFVGENLDFMRAMDSETIDLIATDPPFNKGRDFHATPESIAKGARFQDRWKWLPEMDAWLEEIRVGKHSQVASVIETARDVHGKDLGAFLCFLGIRLIVMRRLLKPTGSIFLHCDHSAGHYIKAVMDAVFGRKNFKNEIVWHYQAGTRPGKAFGRKHDTIFWYTKSNKWVHNKQGQPVQNPDRYDQVDEDGRRFLWGGNWSRTLRRGTRRYYLDEGQSCDDVWTWVREPEFNSLNSQSKERVGWPTQKPVALYERIIKAASNKGDLVLDPFAGCATTCVAAEKLGRQWVGIDLWPKAIDIVRDRLSRAAFSDSMQGLTANDVIELRDIPKRTDEGEIVPVSDLPVPEITRRPRDSFRNKEERKAFLAKHYGDQCQGCKRMFDSPRFLHLDHNTPKSQNGWDHICNMVLLCGPCNGMKSDEKTLKGLRRANKASGWMQEGEFKRDILKHPPF